LVGLINLGIKNDFFKNIIFKKMQQDSSIIINFIYFYTLIIFLSATIVYTIEYYESNLYVKNHINSIETICNVNNCHYLVIQENFHNIKSIINCSFTSYENSINFTVNNVIVSELKYLSEIDTIIKYFNNSKQKCYLNRNTITYINPNYRNFDKDVKRRHKYLNLLIIFSSIFGFLTFGLFIIKYFKFKILNK